jgi:hypothetical protein
MPNGFVTASTASRKIAICSQPFAVISELLRPQQGVEQIDHDGYGDGEHGNGLRSHESSLQPVTELHIPD